LAAQRIHPGKRFRLAVESFFADPPSKTKAALGRLFAACPPLSLFNETNFILNHPIR